MLRRIVSERLNFALVFGFASCLAWLMITLRAGVLLSGSMNPLQLHIPFYLLLAGSATLTLVSVAIFYRRMSADSLTGIICFLPASAMSLATISLLFISWAPLPYGSVLAALCGLIAGISFAFLLVQWGRLWNILGFKTIVFSSIASWGLCQVFFFVVLLFDQIAAVLVAAALPVVSIVLLRYNEKNTSPVPPFGPRRTKAPTGMILRLSTLGFIYSFFNEYFRLSYIQRNPYDFDDLGFFTTNGLALLLVLIVVFMTIFLPAIRQLDILFELPYRLLLMLSVLGALLLIIPGLSPMISYAINTAAYLCLGITLWSVTICLCRRFPYHTIKIFGIVFAAWMAGPLVGAQLNHELITAGMLPVTEVSMVVGVFIMVLIYCFVFRETDIADTTMEGRTGAFEEKCAQVSWKHRLTERESELLTHLARGRDAGWIQEEFCLSKSTVSTHRQHIYEKLGVHTRQELIDLIDAQ
ncbi:MAG: helix-turn-helix transcriptional regulator [Coriobacteriaceae bacterium]|nr:helix-turn-helix transcriptional regulator [Coriobacteriaceae bacterium]